MVTEPTKNWWESRTIVINLVIGFLVGIEAFTGATKDILPFGIYEMAAIILPALNTFLRTISNTTINPIINNIKQDL